MKLVGSRSKGTNRPNSDWDIAVPGVIEVRLDTTHGAGYEFPRWTEAVDGQNIPELKEKAREMFDIPEGHKIDLFFYTHCQCIGKELFAVIYESGYTVAMARTLEGVIDEATNGIKY
jgi:hypothetical protein